MNSHKDPGGRECDTGRTLPGCSHEEISARAAAGKTWTDRALLVVGAQLSFAEQVSWKYFADRDSVPCRRWRAAYYKLLSRRTREILRRVSNIG